MSAMAVIRFLRALQAAHRNPLRKRGTHRDGNVCGQSKPRRRNDIPLLFCSENQAIRIRIRVEPAPGAAGQVWEFAVRRRGCNRPSDPGEAKITAGYGLPARHVIHTVGPVWEGGAKGEAERLASCYRESIRLAVEHGLTSIAFPAISTGIYGYPKDQAARISADAVQDALNAHGGSSLRRVVFCCYEKADADRYRALMAR